MIKTFEDFRDTVSAYRLPGVIISALELDLFTAIGRKSRPLSKAVRQKLRFAAFGRNLPNRGAFCTIASLKDDPLAVRRTIRESFTRAMGQLNKLAAVRFHDPDI